MKNINKKQILLNKMKDKKMVKKDKKNDKDLELGNCINNFQSGNSKERSSNLITRNNFSNNLNSNYSLHSNSKLLLNLAGPKNSLEYYTSLVKKNSRSKTSNSFLSGMGSNYNNSISGNSYSTNLVTNLTCSKPQLKNKLYQAMHKTLTRKYYKSKSDFDGQVIENLIYNKNCHIVSIFKEYMILDFIDEFLKRGYKIQESTERIPKFANYYKNYLKFFCNPVFRDLKVNAIVQVYGDNKAELYYNRNYATKKKNEKRGPFDENMRTIFNTTVKENIDKNSMTQSQLTIKRDLLEINENYEDQEATIEVIEVFKPVDFMKHNMNNLNLNPYKLSKDPNIKEKQNYPKNNMYLNSCSSNFNTLTISNTLHNNNSNNIHIETARKHSVYNRDSSSVKKLSSSRNNSTHLELDHENDNFEQHSFLVNENDVRRSREQSLLNILSQFDQNAPIYEKPKFLNSKITAMKKDITLNQNLKTEKLLNIKEKEKEREKEREILKNLNQFNLNFNSLNLIKDYKEKDSYITKFNTIATDRTQKNSSISKNKIIKPLSDERVIKEFEDRVNGLSGTSNTQIQKNGSNNASTLAGAGANLTNNNLGTSRKFSSTKTNNYIECVPSTNRKILKESYNSNDFQTLAIDRSIVGSTNLPANNNYNISNSSKTKSSTYKVIYENQSPNTQVNGFKSPQNLKSSSKESIFRSTEYKNLKVNNPNNFNSNENNQRLLNLASSNLMMGNTIAGSLHIKNVYSSELGGSSSNLAGTLYAGNNLLLKNLNTIEKSCSNSNTCTINNTPSLNCKTVNKVSQDSLKLKKIKPEMIVKKDSSSGNNPGLKIAAIRSGNSVDNSSTIFQNNTTNFSNMRKFSQPSGNQNVQSGGSNSQVYNGKNTMNIINNTNANINNILQSSHKNFQSLGNLGNSSNLQNMNSPSGALTNLNDIMKITLSLYMDKTSRNRSGSNMAGNSTLLDTGRKTTIINKVDNINNFNININSAANLNNINDQLNSLLTSKEAISKNTIQLRDESERDLLDSPSKNTNIIIRNKQGHGLQNNGSNSNIKSIFEKNKNLSRNKNQSLYRLPSNQGKSQKDDEDGLRSSIVSSTTGGQKINVNGTANKGSVSDNPKIYSSHGSNIGTDTKGNYYTSTKLNDNLRPTYKNSQNLKQTLDDYHSYNFKKNTNPSENLNSKLAESKSPFKYANELSSSRNSFANKKNLNSNSNLTNDKKITKIKVGSSSDVKKLISPSGSMISAMNTISSSNNPMHSVSKLRTNNLESNNLSKGAKGVNIYGSSTNSTGSKKYLSIVRK